MKYRVTFALILLVCTAAANAAGPDIKPGLWEHKATLESESGELERAMAEMKAQLANMPAAQREMMAEMLKKQGMDMDFDKQTFTSCLTKEQAQSGNFHIPKAEDGCEQTITERSRDRLAMTFSCAGNPPEQGKGEITFHSDTRYSGTFQLDTQVEGKPERLRISQEGTWLGRDCGEAGR